MTWSQIKEVENESFAVIGHHSHSHEYLINKSNENFIKDIETANENFSKNLAKKSKILANFANFAKNTKIRQFLTKKMRLANGTKFKECIV